MGQMFNMLFALITDLFAALQQFVGAINNVATWTNEASGTWADVSRYERQQAVEKLKREAGIEEFPEAETKPTPSQRRKLTKANNETVIPG